MIVSQIIRDGTISKMECTAQQMSFGICIMGAARSNCVHAFMIQKGDPGAKKPDAVKKVPLTVKIGGFIKTALPRAERRMQGCKAR